MCRIRFFHTTCNKHDWTCTVPWHVFLLCVETLQTTMTTTHLGMVIEQTSGDPRHMARVPSKQATRAPRRTDGESVCRIRFLDTDSSRPTHARIPEDDRDRFMLGFLKGLPFQFFEF